MLASAPTVYTARRTKWVRRLKHNCVMDQADRGGRIIRPGVRFLAWTHPKKGKERWHIFGRLRLGASNSRPPLTRKFLGSGDPRKFA